MKLLVQKTDLSTILVAIIILCLFTLSSAGNFSYKDTNSWVKEWPTCGGRKQSPVDITVRNLDESQRHNKIKLHNFFEAPHSLKLFNNGHTVQLTYQWGDKITAVSDGILNGTYHLDSQHFHWHSRNIGGSEHTFEGKRAAIEMQSFFYNAKYGSVANATHQNDGFVIMSDFWFTEPLQSLAVESPKFNELWSRFPEVSNPGASIDIEPLPAGTLAPSGSNTIAWVVYAGSLTVPPCTENVVWVLNPFPHLINEALFKQVQGSVQLENHDDHNYREIQPLDDRPLFWMGSEGSW